MNSLMFLLAQRAGGRPFMLHSMGVIPGHAVVLALLPQLAAHHLERGNKGPSFRILEIGSYMGASTVAWLHALDEFNEGSGHITCVDLWYKTPEITLMSDRSEIKHSVNVTNHDVFRYNVLAASGQMRVTELIGDSRTTLPMLADQQFDIVYVDGFHGRSVVRSDVANAKRLIKPGGVVCGDDMELPLSEISQETLQRAADQDSIPFDTNPEIGWHPDVSLAVTEAFGVAKSYAGLWAFKNIDKRRWEPVDCTALPRVVPPFLTHDTGAFVKRCFDSTITGFPPGHPVEELAQVKARL